MSATTFRLESKHLSHNPSKQALRDDAFETWQKFVQQKMIAAHSAFTLDPTTLREDIQDWFAQYKSRYRLSMRFSYRNDVPDPQQAWDGMECITEIDIPSEEVALLFKLTWIGA